MVITCQLMHMLQKLGKTVDFDTSDMYTMDPKFVKKGIKNLIGKYQMKKNIQLEWSDDEVETNPKSAHSSVIKRGSLLISPDRQKKLL